MVLNWSIVIFVNGGLEIGVSVNMNIETSMIGKTIIRVETVDSVIKLWINEFEYIAIFGDSNSIYTVANLISVEEDGNLVILDSIQT